MTHGLYDLNDGKDNCGFGLIAHLHGEASHHLVRTAIEALASMTHRGGIAADGRTGDGCGLLLQKPDLFLRRAAQACGAGELTALYGVGMLMLSQDEERAATARRTLDEELAAVGLQAAGWRPVPTAPSCLGPIALTSLPQFAQVFVNAPDLDQAQLTARLFIARRRAEKRLATDPDSYVASLSAGTVVYKGLMMPVDLAGFFPDLADPDLTSAICLFHQRFSTNTMPRWPLAQPFRLLAHNGEINTITGNRNWAEARTGKFRSPLLPDIEAIAPLVNRTGSDSSSLDNMLEVLVAGGMDLHRAIRMLIPPAWQNVEHLDPDLRAFYEFNSMHTEAWDGPAGLVLTDGRFAVCALDRNGLRPSRWVLSRDHLLTVASEVGVSALDPGEVAAKGRLGPGQLLSVDTKTGTLRHTAEVDDELKRRHPYKQWLKDNTLRLEGTLGQDRATRELEGEPLCMAMKMYQVSLEERDQLLRPLAETGQEAVGSMGDDTPMAVLSRQQRPLSDWFRQQFAQVTNPPIDPLREAVVMSLETTIGPEQQSIFAESEQHANRVILTSPVLSTEKYRALLHLDRWGYRVHRLPLGYDPEQTDLRAALEALCREAAAAVRAGAVLLLLSDQDCAPPQLPVHALLAVGGVHHHLCREGLRCDANLIVATATARDPHQVACLIGFGATAIYPYLGYAVLADLCRTGSLDLPADKALKNYRRGIKKGLLKILSKMGIATVASYRGAQLFEIIGLDAEVVDRCFPGTPSRIGGATFADLEADQRALARAATRPQHPIQPGGLLKYVHGQEYHAFNPEVVLGLQAAVA
ncbi:MAG: glutamate synthase large subunit, partial [Desulfobulbus sp.]|nr:glutamate synthase large subunit [Desulfobulbus sp.]